MVVGDLYDNFFDDVYLGGKKVQIFLFDPQESNVVIQFKFKYIVVVTIKFCAMPHVSWLVESMHYIP